jgi:hypothetical protein
MHAFAASSQTCPGSNPSAGKTVHSPPGLQYRFEPQDALLVQSGVQYGVA